MPSGQQVWRHLRRLIGARPADELADAPLLERFLTRRDAAAFEALVQRYGPLVLGVCRRVLEDEHDAEDAFQATFLVFARRADGIRNAGALGSWLCGTAYRVSLKARAARVRRRAQEKEAGTQLKMDRETEAAWNELKPILDEELNRLPEKYRVPLVLCYLEGKTNEDAARELGWAPGSMSYRLAQARERLRERLVLRGVALTSGLLGPALALYAKAAVPPKLVEPTVQGAVLFQAGQAVAGVLSAQAVALAEAMLHAAHLFKMMLMALVGLFLIVLLGGVGWVLYHPGGGTQLASNGTVVQPLDDEDRIAVQFSERQEFGLSILRLRDPNNPEKPKRLTRNERGNTNSTRLRIDDAYRTFGAEVGGARWVRDRKGRPQREIQVGERKWLSVMEFEPERVRVTQTVEIVVGEQTRLYDTALVKYTIENRDTKPHTVGLRSLVDTFIGGNDGVPFYVPPTEKAPAHLLETMEVFSQAQVPDFIRALESSNPADQNATVAEMGLKLKGLEPLEKMVICRWPDVEPAGWEWPFQAMNEPPGKEKDSCVVLYWARQKMATGEQRTTGFTYGLGRIADGTGSEEPAPMRLLAGGSSRVGRAFTLTAYVKGARAGQKVSLQLPPELTLVGDQTLEQPIEPRPGQEYAQVSWRVKASKVGNFRVLGWHGRRSVSLEVHIRESSIFD